MSKAVEEFDDPLALLESTAKKQNAEKKLLERIGVAKKKLVLGKTADMAFWATLALRMKHKADWSIDTALTDGKELKINPLFYEELTDQERLGILAHETCHTACSHHCRIGHRDKKLWNIACDLVANPLLLQTGFVLPKQRLLPGEGEYKDIPKDLSVEKTYELLLKKQAEEKQEDEPQDGEGGEGEGEGEGDGQPGQDPGRCGGIEAPGSGSPAEIQQAESEMKIAVAQARNAAKMRGKLSASLDRWINEQLEAVVDWREVLREFVSKEARSDYNWNPPNRRFVHMGLFLPGMRSQELGDVVVAIDTSGSIGEKEMNVFAGEIEGIMDNFPGASLTILFCDAAIQHVQQYKSSDGPLKLEPKGGGGTSHIPVFKWIEDSGEEPTCLVCLTDLCSSFPEQAPSYPVLWATTEKGSKGPFGQTVEVII